MRLTRLRIVGFKTFVEPTDFLIEPGLTGVIGPNGCGKSNLVEALRWVMGESSHKNMRASGMDDVIFSGNGSRPGRNHAEVTLGLDNSERTAPAAFNDGDALEVSRRIVREAGSTYRVNGREVRARDVQLLFADAATGARSPAMVRQGQIAELIAAKPQARRRILEDAAGIAGLHARRHEAELRLKAAEENLARVEDVLGALDTQLESLKRQARGAQRYRTVSAEIRRLDALLALIGHGAARREVAQAERTVEAALAEVAVRQDAQARGATEQAVAAAAIPALREAEATAAGELQRLIHAAAALDAEERRTKERLADLTRQIGQMERDGAREAEARGDAEASLARLEREAREIAGEGGAPDQRTALSASLTAVEARTAAAEAEVQRAQRLLAEARATAVALANALRDETARAGRLAAEAGRLRRDSEALSTAAAADLAPLRQEAEEALGATRDAETRAAEARSALVAAREAEAAGRRPLAEAEREAQRLETEVRTLAKLLLPPVGAKHARILDALSVAPGYEAALAAALGDDLEVTTDPTAAAHWRELGAGEGDPSLPEGTVPLADHVDAPSALARRLRQIGVVEDAEKGAALRTGLAPGQRLVSRAGDLWRWDGLTLGAEAPSPAARRLAERNRLGALGRDAEAARDRLEARRAEARSLQETSRAAAAAEAETQDEARRARATQDAAREALSSAERRDAEAAARRAALAEAASRAAREAVEAEERRAAAETALGALPDASELAEIADVARETAEDLRAETAQARADLLAHDQAASARERERERIAAERTRWTARAAKAAAACIDLAERLDAAREELGILAEAPDTVHVARRRLLGERTGAEAARKAAADRLAAAELAQAEADRAARAALDALAAAREARAAAQAAYEGLARRLAEIERGIAETLETDPAGLWPLAGLAPGADLPPAAETERRLTALKADRERLGAVNLRAEQELEEADARRGGLAVEREDLAEAIKRLRGAIGNLNREGRERLLAAFTAVNAHFERLFTTLFSGGTAELTLVDSDDPLEAGLEILARPPGKKPQTMTLLSGGEQALTATALIFAVFLTNPSPICVLDEVDAPLDDANVERYCDLLAGMARDTDTRFLVITHNPITMARMDRLYGVTMVERGASQLVSVDLAAAERLREAG